MFEIGLLHNQICPGKAARHLEEKNALKVENDTLTAKNDTLTADVATLIADVATLTVKNDTLTATHEIEKDILLASGKPDMAAICQHLASLSKIYEVSVATLTAKNDTLTADVATLTAKVNTRRAYFG